jgi:hypothetical protein
MGKMVGIANPRQRRVSPMADIQHRDIPHKVSLGGKQRSLNKLFILVAKVEGCPVETNAYILDEIGKDEEGKPMDILFGALAMQQWGIHPISDEERLDMTHYTKEFLEFYPDAECPPEDGLSPYGRTCPLASPP